MSNMNHIKRQGLLNVDAPDYSELAGAVERPTLGGFCYSYKCRRKELKTTDKSVVMCPDCKEALVWKRVASNSKLKSGD